MADVILTSGRTGAYNDASGLSTVYVPWTIYFYYVKSETTATGTKYSGATLYILEKQAAIPQSGLDAEVVELIRNARKTDPDEPEPTGKGFGHDPWRRRSYLVVALDDPAGDNGFEPGQAVKIVRKKNSGQHGNHCFFDGGEKTVDVDGIDVGYMWVVNYMKTKSGKDIPDGKSHVFGFKFKPLKQRLFPDDSEDHGTNMGPPIGPP